MKEPALHQYDQLSGQEGAASREDLYHDRQFSARIRKLRTCPDLKT